MMNRVAVMRLGMAILLVLPLFACSGWFLDEQQLMKNADAYLAEKNINAGIIELKNVLQANPDHARARYLLAGINLEYGDFETAVKEFRRAEVAGWNREEVRIGIARSLLGGGLFSKLRDAAQPEDTWTAQGRANLLALQAVAEAGLGNAERAADLATQAAQLDPAALHVFKVRAQLHILAGQLGEARDILASAMERYPDNQELMLLYASLYQRLGENDAALKAYRQVMDADPRGFISMHGRNARLQLTQLQIISGDYRQAEGTLRPLYGRDPKDPFTNYLGGVIAFEQGNYPRAEQLFLKVLKLAPEHNPTRLLYGTVNFAEKNYEQAAYFLAKYLVAVPDNLAARKLLARSYILLGRAEEAHAILQNAHLDQMEDAELLALTGLSELARGDRLAGIAGLERALKLDSGNLQIRTELARAYIDAGDTGLAVRELKSILAEGGKKLETEVLLVLAHLRAGDFSQAIKLALEMLRGQENDPALQTLVGNVFAASGDHDEARRYLQRALQISPGLPPAVMSMANIEEIEKNYPVAAKLYQQLVDMEQESVLPMLALARVAEQQGNQEVMLNWLQRAIKHAPDDNQPRLLMAEYYLRKGSVELARPLVKAVLEKSPRDTTALAMQGRMLMSRKEYDDALKPLNKLLSYEPDSVVARILLGECYLELGRHKDAREQLEAALDSDPASVPAMSLLARLEIENGAPARGLEFGKRIQQVYPELYLGYQLAGDALIVRGDYQGAGSEYALARDRMQQVDLVIKQAENASRSGNNAAAAGYLQDWLSNHPDDVRAMLFLGAVWQNMKMTELAVKQYEKVLVLDGDNPIALNNLAGLYQLAGRPEALALAERALKHEPGNPSVMDTYAWIQVQQGNTAEGLRMLEQVITQLPDNPEVRYHHAVAVHQSGDRDRARQLLKALLDKGEPFDGRDEAMRMLEASRD